MSDSGMGKRKKSTGDTVKKTYKIAVALSSVTQTAVSFLVPVFIFVFAAKYFTKRFDLPQFVIVLGIVIGVICGFYSSFKYIITASKAADKENGE